MELLQLCKDESAVSPVIGVVLMVAITVILAAVIGTAVLSIGNQASQAAPQLSAEMSYNSTHLTISHQGGDTVENSTLNVTETGSTDDISVTATGDVSAGDEIAVGTYESGETIRLVWTSSDGESSAVIAESEAP